jgi:hypothetical protein
MMKRIGSLALAVIMCLTLVTACGGSLSKPQNGTYKSDDFLGQTWTFSSGDNITLSVGIISSKGTYRIDGETLYVTSSLLGTETTSSYTITEIKSDSFFIDGTKFIKQ